MTQNIFGLTGEGLHDGKIAVIDIGSNSVRLVVYDAIKRAPLPLYNEKSFCALGENLHKNGRLSASGKEKAFAAMGRFIALVRAMDVVELDVLATAAVRDAEDGQAFVETLEEAYGISIQIISGKREAKLAAYGALSSIYKPDGVVGDLGGGSMELVRLENDGLGKAATLPIGILRLIGACGRDRDAMRKLVSRELEALDWLSGKTDNFYAIGGTLRAIAKQHMQRSKHPIYVLHHYAVEAEEAMALARDLAKMTPHEVADLPGASGKRSEAYLPAAVVLEQVLKLTKAQRVIFSTHGIREGYLYDKLSPSLKREDPLLAGCADFASKSGYGTAYARELFAWIEPLFDKEKEKPRRLRFAACLLSEIAWRVHPEYRGTSAFDRIISSSLVGLSHRERVMLALTLYHRHHYKRKDNFKPLDLLDEKSKLWARLTGRLMNLAYQMVGGVEGTLPKTRLQVEKGKITLAFPKDLQPLMGDAVQKRLDGLGEIWSAWTSLDK